MALDVMRFLTPEMKREVVMQRLWAQGAPLSSRVTIAIGRTPEDDFEVHRKGEQVSVVVSIPLNSSRFSEVMARCAEAITVALKQTQKVPMRKTDFHCVECGSEQVWQARRVLVCIECGCSFKLQIVE